MKFRILLFAILGILVQCQSIVTNPLAPIKFPNDKPKTTATKATAQQVIIYPVPYPVPYPIYCANGWLPFGNCAAG